MYESGAPKSTVQDVPDSATVQDETNQQTEAHRHNVDVKHPLLIRHKTEVYDMCQGPDGIASQQSGKELLSDGGIDLPRLPFQSFEGGIEYDDANWCEKKLVDRHLGKHSARTALQNQSVNEQQPHS